MLNYLSAAKALENLYIELMEKGDEVPVHVVNDLRAGRSLANIWLQSPDDAETASKAMSALERVEMNLLALAEERVNRAYADEWQARIAEAYKESFEPAAKKPTFVAGVPKGNHWVRIETKDLFEIGNVEQRLRERSLTIRKQDDGFTLIHGKKEDVTGFLGEIREEIRQNILSNRKVGV